MYMENHSGQQRSSTRWLSCRKFWRCCRDGAEQVALVRNRRGHDLIGVIARYLPAYPRQGNGNRACVHSSRCRIRSGFETMQRFMVASILWAALTGAAHAADITLLNVSYDPT